VGISGGVILWGNIKEFEKKYKSERKGKKEQNMEATNVQ
jgi:hypothetical protein